METIHNNADILLVKQFCEGNRAAFAKLFDLYYKKVYWFAYKYLPNEEEAEEVVQEVFVKLWENRERVKSEYNLLNYLFTITKNHIFNLKRRQKTESAFYTYLKDYYIETESETEELLIADELERIIAETIEAFPPQRKLVFQLSREQGLSYKEITEKLNISVKTVETHIRLALKELRKRVGVWVIMWWWFENLSH